VPILANGPVPEENPYVIVCRLDGMIDDGLTVLVKRAVSEAKDAQAIIWIIDTPGGRVDSAMTITDAILKAPCRTIAFVDGMGAISAGALISYACDEIVMAPASNIGAAQPVTFSEEGMKPLGEKETSFVRAKFAALAEQKGRNPDIAMAMVDMDIELRAYPKPDGTYEVRAASVPVTRSQSSTGDIAREVVEGLLKPLKDMVNEAAGEEVIPKSPDTTETPAEAATDTPMVAPDGGTIILASGKLLTLTPKDAQKYGLIQHIAEDVDQVKWSLGLENARSVAIEMTWSEELYRWLTSPLVTMLLLMLGIGGLYVEIRTPGFGLPGIVGIVCLALFFGSRAVIGLANWIDLVLVLVGVVLILIEVFVLPGFGIIGVLGIVAVIAGVFLSFTHTDFSIPQYSWEFDRLEEAGFTLTMTTVLLLVFGIATWKLLPRTPLYRRLVLGQSQLIEEGYTVQEPDEADSLVGARGVATSMLRPAGRGRFGNKTLQVVSRAEFIDSGTPIVIVEVEGNRYVVDPVERKAS
jgi:membrane-bound serine protease (ClpP class)